MGRTKKKSVEDKAADALLNFRLIVISAVIKAVNDVFDDIEAGYGINNKKRGGKK